MDPHHYILKNIIEDPQVNRHYYNGYNDYACGTCYLLASGPRHLFHLQPYFAKKSDQLFEHYGLALLNAGKIRFQR